MPTNQLELLFNESTVLKQKVFVCKAWDFPKEKNHSIKKVSDYKQNKGATVDNGAHLSPT